MLVGMREIVIHVHLERQALVQLGVEKGRGGTPVRIFLSFPGGHVLKDIVRIGVFFVRCDIAPFVRFAGIHARDGHFQILEAGGKIHQPVVLPFAKQFRPGREPIGKLDLDIGTDVELGGSAAHAVMAHDALIVQVSDRGIGPYLFRTPGDRDIMVLHEAVVERFLEPVGIGIGDAVLDAVGIQLVGMLLGVFPKGDGLVRIDMGDADIVGALVDQPHGLGIIGHVLQAAQIRHLDRHIVIVRDMDLAGRAALGGDKDDAVRSPGPVDGRRGGVLQDSDGLDVLRVDVVHGILDAVHQDQRAVGVEGGIASNPQGGAVFTGLAGGLGDRQAGGQAAQGR